MGTTFGIIDKEGEVIEIAKRGGVPLFRWLNNSGETLKDKRKFPNKMAVHPLDNSPQGIFTLGDIRKEISKIEKKENAVKKFLIHMNKMVKYWDSVETSSSKAECMLFTFLVMLDGGDSEFLSGFDLIDRESGENISIGHLHEIMQKYEESLG